MISYFIFGKNFKNKIFNFPAGLGPEIETGSLFPPAFTRPEMTSDEREWKIMSLVWNFELSETEQIIVLLKFCP